MTTNDSTELVILDDDVVLIGLIKRIVKDDNCTVRDFTVQEDCLVYLSNSNPTYLFVDMKMPRMNGLQFIKKLKNQGFIENTRIFLCSGVSPENEVRSQMTTMGVEVIDKDNVCNKAWLRSTLGLNESLI